MESKLLKILDLFSKLSGIAVEIQMLNITVELNLRFDALISLQIGKNKYPFLVDLINKSTSDIERIKIRNLKLSNILFMGHLSKEMKAYCIKHGMAFITHKGQYSIPLVLQGLNHTPASTEPGKVTVTPEVEATPSSATMSHLLHYLLAGTQADRTSQRTVAKETGLSLATVNNLLGALVEKKYLVNMRSKRRIIDPDRIWNLWLFEYERNLESKLTVERYATADEKSLRDLRENAIRLGDGYWSAAKAADILLDSEIPLNLMIYTDQKSSVLKQLRLRPDAGGSVLIRKKFWTFDWTEKEQGIATLPTIYADLMMTRDPRDEAVAKEIKMLWKKNLS